MSKSSVKKVKWSQFRESGLLWFINTTLHAFGFAIVLESNSINPNDDYNAYIARTTYRGFTEKSNTTGYRKLARYMKDNSEDIYKEAVSDSSEDFPIQVFDIIGEDYKRDFMQGAKRTRDCIICTLIGFQNDCKDTNSEEYKAYQKVIDNIEETFGPLMGEVKL